MQTVFSAGDSAVVYNVRGRGSLAPNAAADTGMPRERRACGYFLPLLHWLVSCVSGFCVLAGIRFLYIEYNVLKCNIK